MYDIGGRVTQLGEERKTVGSSRDVVIVKSLTKYGLEEEKKTCGYCGTSRFVVETIGTTFLFFFFLHELLSSNFFSQHLVLNVDFWTRLRVLCQYSKETHKDVESLDHMNE
jgi:hypothetical protein